MNLFYIAIFTTKWPKSDKKGLKNFGQKGAYRPPLLFPIFVQFAQFKMTISPPTHNPRTLVEIYFPVPKPECVGVL